MKLLQLLATLSLHNEEVRSQIFREVDFLDFTKARGEDEAGVLQAMTCALSGRRGPSSAAGAESLAQFQATERQNSRELAALVVFLIRFEGQGLVKWLQFVARGRGIQRRVKTSHL